MSIFNADLNKNIEKLNENLEKQNSVKRNIWMSIIKGAATAIGATVVAGLIIWLVASGTRRAGGLPYVGDWFKNVEINSPVDSGE